MSGPWRFATAWRDGDDLLVKPRDYGKEDGPKTRLVGAFRPLTRDRYFHDFVDYAATLRQVLALCGLPEDEADKHQLRQRALSRVECWDLASKGDATIGESP